MKLYITNSIHKALKWVNFRYLLTVVLLNFILCHSQVTSLTYSLSIILGHRLEWSHSNPHRNCRNGNDWHLDIYQAFRRLGTDFGFFRTSRLFLSSSSSYLILDVHRQTERFWLKYPVTRGNPLWLRSFRPWHCRLWHSSPVRHSRPLLTCHHRDKW